MGEGPVQAAVTDPQLVDNGTSLAAGHEQVIQFQTQTTYGIAQTRQGLHIFDIGIRQIGIKIGPDTENPAHGKALESWKYSCWRNRSLRYQQGDAITHIYAQMTRQ